METMEDVGKFGRNSFDGGADPVKVSQDNNSLHDLNARTNNVSLGTSTAKNSFPTMPREITAVESRLLNLAKEKPIYRRRRHSSTDESPEKSDTRRTRSPDRRGTRSPRRRSKSRDKRRSPSTRKSYSPHSRRSQTPYKARTRSPRKRSRSRDNRRTRSPDKRSRSPDRRRARSPVKRSRSRDKRRTRSPDHRRSRSPKRGSRSGGNSRSRSRSRERSRVKSRKSYSRSPRRRRRSRSSGRRRASRSRSTERRRRRSRSSSNEPRRRSRSRSRSRRRSRGRSSSPMFTSKWGQKPSNICRAVLPAGKDDKRTREVTTEDVEKRLADHMKSVQQKAAEEAKKINLPGYLNPAMVNVHQFKQVQDKRKLLWSKSKEKKEDSAQWAGAFQDQSNDEKFRRLMGIQDNVDGNSSKIQQSRKVLDELEKEYEKSRAFQLSRGAGGVTGIGLGFGSGVPPQ